MSPPDGFTLSPDIPRPIEFRDRAILVLLARLGLRAGEIAALGLDDLDWRAGQLRLRAGKSRRERVLPSTQEVGAALADYLQHGRPSCSGRRVFLASTDPVRDLHPAAVTRLVQRNLKRAGIPLGRLTGAHMLRHTRGVAHGQRRRQLQGRRRRARPPFAANDRYLRQA